MVGSKKVMKIVVLILIVLFTIGLAYAATFLDDSQAEFDSGTYANTFYNTSGFMQLNASQTSGNYTSQIFDAVDDASWDNMSWGSSSPDLEILFAVDGVADVWESSDSGANWALTNDDYTGAIGNGATYMVSNSSGSLFILFNQDFFRSDDSGATWNLTNDDITPGTNDGKVLTIDSNSYLYVVDGSDKVLKSTDGGYTFSTINESFGAGPDAGAMIADSDDYLYIIDNAADVWKSTDSGVTWAQVKDDYNGGNLNSVDDMFVDSSDNLYALHNQDLWKSTDSGATWNLINDDFNGGPDSQSGVVMYIDSNDYIYIADGGEDIYQSTDSGLNFNRVAENINGASGNVLGITSILNPASLTFYARSCDDAACSGESWVEVANPLSLGVSNNTYFQYKAEFSTPDASLTPKLYNVTVSYTSLNAIPVSTTPTLTPATAYTNDTLNCTFTVTDTDAGDNLSVNYTWYNSTSAMITGSMNVTNGTSYSLTLDSANTSKAETWNCSVIPYDGASYGIEKSASRTISNSLPTAPVINVTPDIPNDGDDLTCSVKTASTDADSDTITYARQWYKDDVAQAGETANTLSNALTTPGEVWMCVVTPNDGTSDGSTGNDSVTINGTIPIYAVNLISPSNGATWSSSNTVTFEYNTSLNATICELIVDGAVVQNDTNITSNETESFSYYLSNGDYSWAVNCTDINNITNSSATYALTVSYSTGGGGGGGGGGSSSTTTTPATTVILPEEEEICSEFWICEDWSECIDGRKTRTCVDFNACGTSLSRPIEVENCIIEDQLDLEQLNVEQYRVEQTFTVSQNNEISFSYAGETHTITITEITPEKVSVIVRSEPISVDLYPSQPQGIDLDSDGKDDIKLILNFVEDGEAEITLKFVGTGISSITGEAITVLPYKSPKSYYLVPVILLLVLFIVLVSVRKSHLSNKTKKFVTVLHIILMGLIILIFLTSFFKDSIIGAILTNATNTTAAQSSSTISKMPLPMIAFALVIAAVSIIIIFVEREKIKKLFKKKHKGGAKKRKVKKIKKRSKSVKKSKIKPKKRQKSINKLFRQKRRKRKKR